VSFDTVKKVRLIYEINNINIVAFQSAGSAILNKRIFNWLSQELGYSIKLLYVYYNEVWDFQLFGQYLLTQKSWMQWVYNAYVWI
jgi:Tol biopolymer transport system component